MTPFGLGWSPLVKRPGEAFGVAGGDHFPFGAESVLEGVLGAAGLARFGFGAFGLGTVEAGGDGAGKI